MQALIYDHQHLYQCSNTGMYANWRTPWLLSMSMIAAYRLSACIWHSAFPASRQAIGRLSRHIIGSLYRQNTSGKVPAPRNTFPPNQRPFPPSTTSLPHAAAHKNKNHQPPPATSTSPHHPPSQSSSSIPIHIGIDNRHSSASVTIIHDDILLASSSLQFISITSILTLNTSCKREDGSIRRIIW